MAVSVTIHVTVPSDDTPDTPHTPAGARGADGDDTPDPTDISPVFERIQNDPEICTNCFRRYQAVYPINGVFLHGKDSGSRRLRESIADIVTDERIPGEDTHRVPNDPAARGTRRVCACGYPPGETDRPLDKRRFMTYGTFLYRRVAETLTDSLAAALDRAYYHHELYASKRDPAKQFADDRLYAETIALAVHDARHNAKSHDTGDSAHHHANAHDNGHDHDATTDTDT